MTMLQPAPSNHVLHATLAILWCIAGCATASKPPEAATRFAVTAREESISLVADGVALAGTVTIPQTPPPYAAVLLLSGAGPQTRDYPVGQRLLYRDLAEHLARHGILSLRLDDRGTGQSGGDFELARMSDLRCDAELAISYLRSRSDTAQDRVGILGHSEGAMVAAITASHSRDVKFLVLLGFPCESGDKAVLGYQQRLNDDGTKRTVPMDKLDVSMTRYWISLARSSSTTQACEERARQMIAVLAGLKPDATLTPELESSVQSRCRYYLSPAMRELIRWDAVKTMQLVDVPTLLIYGALDLNTDPGAATAFLASIEPQRAHRVQNVILDGLNHMLQEARTGEPAEANSLGSLSDRALNVITSWIAKLPSPVDHNSTRARPR